MIKRLITRFLSGGKRSGSEAPSRGLVAAQVPKTEHRINAKNVDERALDVVRTLKRAGFEAYIVGGAVRDLLLGLVPKDFDVATSATPEEVKALFRRAFIIGRRFRIVHVIYGRGREHEVIEVSTFRANVTAETATQVRGNERTSKAALAHMTHAIDSAGRVLRDNVWGSIEEDAQRRDFTLNAMYYDPETEVVVDFHGGIADARAKKIRMIGDPATRYREDPVRMVRAVRFLAKLTPLGFKLDAKTQKPLLACKPLLADVPQSRLHDEMFKLLQTGHGVASVQALYATGLERGIYPLLDYIAEQVQDDLLAKRPRLCTLALQDTDRRIAQGKGASPSFLLACALWHEVEGRWLNLQHEGYNAHPALQDAIDQVFDERVGDVSGRGKLGGDMREIWALQPRFERRTGKAPYGLVNQLRFRAGFDFLCLRAQATKHQPAQANASKQPDLQTLADWWETFQHATDAEREDMCAEVRNAEREAEREAQKTANVGVKKVWKKPKASQIGAASPASSSTEISKTGAESGATGANTGATEGASPAKKRRRRSKPKGDSVSGAGGPGDARAQ